jgi:hypothetical protein
MDPVAQAILLNFKLKFRLCKPLSLLLLLRPQPLPHLRDHQRRQSSLLPQL